MFLSVRLPKNMSTIYSEELNVSVLRVEKAPPAFNTTELGVLPRFVKELKHNLASKGRTCNTEHTYLEIKVPRSVLIRLANKGVEENLKISF